MTMAMQLSTWEAKEQSHDNRRLFSTADFQLFNSTSNHEEDKESGDEIESVGLVVLNQASGNFFVPLFERSVLTVFADGGANRVWIVPVV